MIVSTHYAPIGNENIKSTQTYFHMMNNLLYSRMEAGFPSNDKYFDEDVNVYLANLLTSLIYPQQHDVLKELIVPYDLSLFESICDQRNPRMKYLAYRANADSLLVSLGVFDNPKGARPNSTQHMNISTESYLGRGKAYYSIAQSYLSQTRHRSTALGDVLGKLSRGFEKYVRIFSVMKSDYFNLIEKISDGELFHLKRTINEEETKAELAVLYDKFLDAYSRFKTERTCEARSALDLAIDELKRCDPSFDFNPDEATPDC